jgi:hypothetical protein
MSLTKTQASCKCGASISTAFTSELADWLGQHQQCLISQPKRYVACPCGTATPREPLTDEQYREIADQVIQTLENRNGVIDLCFEQELIDEIMLEVAETIKSAIEAAHGITKELE